MNPGLIGGKRSFIPSLFLCRARGQRIVFQDPDGPARGSCLQGTYDAAEPKYSRQRSPRQQTHPFRAAYSALRRRRHVSIPLNFKGMQRRGQSVPVPAEGGAMLNLLRLSFEPVVTCANSRTPAKGGAMLTSPICSSSCFGCEFSRRRMG